MAIRKGPGKPIDDRLDPGMMLHSLAYLAIGILVGLIFFVFVL